MKILEIESCGDCPEFNNYEVHNKIKWYCMHQDSLNEDIKNFNTIPSWCPLSDKPEPITGEYLNNWFNSHFTYRWYQGDWNELADEINAHFGVK